MPTRTHAQNAQYAVEVDSDTEIPVFKWHSYVTGESFRAAGREWLEHFEEIGADRYIVNTKNIAAHRSEDKAWLVETWIPEIIERGARAGAGVYPDKTISEMDMSGIVDDLNAIDPRYTFQAFTTDSAALEWLADQ